MLVLTRRSGEILVFIDGADILARVTILHVDGKQVRIGISAPNKWKIMREELLKKPDFKMQGLKDRTADSVDGH